MKKEKLPVTIDKIRQTYIERQTEIQARLTEFEVIWQQGSDEKLWEEMVYCFFTGGCSARMGLRSIDAVRPLLLSGTHEELMNALVGKHRYPRARSGYIVASRNFLQKHCQLELRRVLENFEHLDRRDWLVKEKRIKGLGYKEASHYLRNIGLKGYAILDKHILRCLAELGEIESPKPPTNRRKSLETEAVLKNLATKIEIDFDEIDLVLWSMKAGEILK